MMTMRLCIFNEISNARRRGGVEMRFEDMEKFPKITSNKQP